MNKIVNNRYKIVKLLGKGGMGEVFLVEDLFRSNGVFALKSIQSKFLEHKSSNALSRFKQEYEVMTRLKHPNLTRVYDFGEDENGDYYIIMEYLDGISLKQYLKMKGKLNLDEALDVFVPLLRAVEFIHSRKIIYRDIKPENVIITIEHDRVVKIKLLDFGLADLGEAEKGRIKGTVQYMAPEIVNGETIDRTADIFSLGILLYELLTGTHIYSDTSIDVVVKTLSKSVLFRSSFDLSLQSILTDETKIIIKKAAAFKKEDRFKNCSDMILAINQFYGKDYEIETKATKEAYILGADFVGRAKESAALKKIVSRTNKKLNLITGITGSGKSRMIEEIQKYCNLNGIIYFEANSFLATPYEPFLTILDKMIYHFPSSDLKVDGGYLKNLLPNHPKLTRYKKQTTNDAKTDKELLVEIISNLIIRYSKIHDGKLVLFFSNLHNCDEVSLDVLGELIYKTADRSTVSSSKIAVIAECRDENMENISLFINKLAAKNRLHQIVVTSLNDQETELYINNVFGADKTHSSILNNISAIRERVGGNPLFLQELIRSLVEEEIITVNKSFWVLNQPISKISIPRNVRDIISQRFNKLELSVDEGQALKILGLLYKMEVSAAFLKKVTRDYLTVDWDYLLKYLCQKEILVDKNSKFVESSMLIGEIICSKIDQGENRSIHEFLSVRLEAIYLEKSADLDLLSDEQVEELAYHYSNAQFSHDEILIYKTLYYLKEAAKRAARKYSNKKAIKYYNKIIEFINSANIDRRKTSGTLIISIHNKAEVQTLIGKINDAYQSFADALAIAEEYQVIDKQAECLKGLAKILYFKADYEQAETLIIRALEKHTEIDDQKGIASDYIVLGSIHDCRGKYELSLEKYLIALEISKKSKNDNSMAAIYSNIGNYYLKAQDFNQALEYYNKQLELAKEHNLVKIEALAYANTGIIHFKQHNLKEALISYENSLKIKESIGDKIGISINLLNIGLVFFELGNYKKACKIYEQSLKIKEEIGDKLGISILFGNLAETYEKLDKIDKAKDYLDKSIDLTCQIGAKYYQCCFIISKAILLYNLKNYEESLIQVKQAKLLNTELKNEELSLAINLHDALNKFHLDNKSHNIRLKELLQQYNKLIKFDGDPEFAASVNYLVWQIFSEYANPVKYKKELTDLAKTTLNHYTNLYKTAHKIIYQERLDIINKFIADRK